MRTFEAITDYLTPSWLVNLTAVAAGVLGTAGVIVLSQYQGSQLRQEVFDVRSAQVAGTATPSAYHNITTNIANNHLLGVAPLFIVWACLGLVIYYFTMAIVHSFTNALEIHEEMGYVHASRQALLRDALSKLAVRTAAVIGWFIFIKLSISVIVPYALAAANIASRNFSVSSVLYGLLAVVVIYLDVVLHAAFLRAIALRPRIFRD